MSFTSEVLTVQEALGIASKAMGLVFGYAATSKLIDVPGFVAGIRSYGVVPSRVAPPFAGLLIVVEGLIALAHFTDVGLRFVVPGAVGLLSIFFVATANLLRRGEERLCLCFGTGRDDLVDISSLARIALLLVVELALYWALVINNALIAGSTKGIESFAIAAFVVMLIGWCLALPKFYRAWRIVRS